MSRHHRLSLTPAALVANARAATGITLRDEAIEESLVRLHTSINEEARLTEQGAGFLERELQRLLANRLRMLRDFEAYPEIREQPLQPPVFISGLARTGSTKLQKLLAATGDFNWLPFWQGFNPALLTGRRDEPVQPRIDQADAFLRWYHQAAPAMTELHGYETDEPEEEHLIHDHSLSAGTFSRYCNCSSWFQWLAGRDVRDYLTFARDVLKYLQWQGLQSEAKPWVLKTPTNLGLEREILDVFPGARFIVPHRHPEATTSSVISLIVNWRAPFSEVDIDDIKRTVFEGAAQTMQRHLENRADPRVICLDLSYAEITDAAGNAVEKIYRFLDKPQTAEARSRLDDWERRQGRNRSAHRHALAEYGITPAEVRERYQEYLQFLAQQVPDIVA